MQVTPDTQGIQETTIQNPTQIPVDIVQPQPETTTQVVAKAEKPTAEQLAEKAKGVIARLNQANIESLRSGHKRLGYLVGEDENEVFILAQPVTKQETRPNSLGGTDTFSYNQYVAFTRSGVRIIWFDKTIVADQPMDMRYNNSELKFQQELDAHASRLENNDGTRPDNYGPFKHDPDELMYYRYMGEYGYGTNTNGQEMLLINNVRIQSDSEHGSGLSADVDPNTMNDALSKSKAAAQEVRPVVQTSAEQQISLLDSVGI